MCLDLETLDLKTTDTDMVVYKMMTPMLQSYYHFEQWTLGELKTVPRFGIMDSLCGGYAIYEGLHSYLTYNKAAMIAIGLRLPSVIVKCMIPKGSEYYSLGDEVVSLALKPIEVVCGAPQY